MTTTPLSQPHTLNRSHSDPSLTLEEPLKRPQERSIERNAPALSKLEPCSSVPSPKSSSSGTDSFRTPLGPRLSSVDLGNEPCSLHELESVCSWKTCEEGSVSTLESLGSESDSDDEWMKLSDSESDSDSEVDSDSNTEAAAPKPASASKRDANALWGIARGKLHTILPDAAEGGNHQSPAPKLAAIVDQAIAAAAEKKTTKKITDSNTNLKQYKSKVSTKSRRFDSLNQQLSTLLNADRLGNSRKLRKIIKSLEGLNQGMSGLANSCKTEHAEIKKLSDIITPAHTKLRNFSSKGFSSFNEIDQQEKMANNVKKSVLLESQWEGTSNTASDLKAKIEASLDLGIKALHQHKMDKYLSLDQTLFSRAQHIGQTFTNMEISSSSGRNKAVKSLEKEIKQLKKEIGKVIGKLDKLPSNLSSETEIEGAVVRVTVTNLKESFRDMLDNTLPELQNNTQTLIDGKYRTAKMNKYQGMFQALHQKHGEAIGKKERALNQINPAAVEAQISNVEQDLTSLQNNSLLSPGMRKAFIFFARPMNQFKEDIKLLKKINKAQTAAEKAQQKLEAAFNKRVTKLNLSKSDASYSTLAQWKTVDGTLQAKTEAIDLVHGRLSDSFTSLKQKVSDFRNHDPRSNRSSAAASTVPPATSNPLHKE